MEYGLWIIATKLIRGVSEEARWLRELTMMMMTKRRRRRKREKIEEGAKVSTMYYCCSVR